MERKIITHKRIPQKKVLRITLNEKKNKSLCVKQFVGINTTTDKIL